MKKISNTIDNNLFLVLLQEKFTHISADIYKIADFQIWSQIIDQTDKVSRIYYFTRKRYEKIK